MAGEMSNPAVYAALIGKTVEEFGSIDILVNNAGVIRRAPAAEFSPQNDWDELIAVNLTSGFPPFAARRSGYVEARCKRQDRQHRVPVLSFQGGILVPAYAAAKGGVAQLTKALANEWASKGINVNAIAPGYMATDNTTALAQDPAAQPSNSRTDSGRPLGRSHPT